MPNSLVVGAGVIGLAVARRLAIAGHEVFIVEASGSIGTGISSRNSEVIHSGIYYPRGTLKAFHCLRGRRLLYDFCRQKSVNHRKCGKLIVAIDESETEKLEFLFQHGQSIGVDGLSILDAVAVRDIEPALRCRKAILSSETGVIDSHGFMLALQADIEANGGILAFHTNVSRISPSKNMWRVHIGQDVVDFDFVFNCAGLGAQALAESTEGFPPESIPQLYLAKGSYFSYSGKAAFSRLVYPLPVDGGLGTHLTLDLSGRMKFGPDVEWTNGIDFTVDADRLDSFYESVRRFWPAVEKEKLYPDYAGIRPKLSGPAGVPMDFALSGPESHGLPGYVALFGIESPGLTSCLSLAESVCELLFSSHERPCSEEAIH